MNIRAAGMFDTILLWWWQFPILLFCNTTGWSTWTKIRGWYYTIRKPNYFLALPLVARQNLHVKTRKTHTAELLPTAIEEIIPFKQRNRKFYFSSRKTTICRDRSWQLL